MKRMTYATLMKKCEEGKAQVEQWDVKMGLALVTFFPPKIHQIPTRGTVEVTGIPAGQQN